MFDVCTTGDRAHINTMFKLLPHTRQRMCGNNLKIISMCAMLPMVHTSNISSCQKKLLQFSYGCENSIKLGLLVFLL